MNTTDLHKNLSSQLEQLASHVNDSLKGFEKAAGSVSPEADTQRFLAMKTTREPLLDALNERLQCIGENAETSGSVKGATHRALISVKDLFTDSNSSEAIYEEAVRGETKLLEYIYEAFSDLETIDHATREAIVELKGNVLRNISELKQHCSA
ncbi:DUF2383 domain-containing protein [Pelagicoccus sp. SDUM812002]|uniref:DUF2383 domain-containing protein n=1 Tax=Pelagicoccus sp. SDUM812002 TaxID=3041266 RepID=UPI00280EB86C|nr:DUF2383 domain-containing protein [Pelagicoccus sp. SDUM812002]MDQ8187603.1 DUF2383 domain-containing protein [Pelagicoccus sp. SDUM812002]